MYGDGESDFTGMAERFLGGDHDCSPFGTWVHYVQTGFIAIVFFIFMFCGCSSGG